jgi:hypothetical protein
MTAAVEGQVAVPSPHQPADTSSVVDMNIRSNGAICEGNPKGGCCCSFAVLWLYICAVTYSAITVHSSLKSHLGSIIQGPFLEAGELHEG